MIPEILKNGAKVYTEINSALNFAAAEIFIKGGSRYEKGECSGISYLIDALVAANTDSEVNGTDVTTYKEFSVYKIAASPPDYKKSVDALFNAMNPENWKNNFNEEKKQMLERIQEKDSYDADGYFESLIFRGQGLGNPVCGEYAAAEKITFDMAAGRLNFTGENMFAVISGNVTDEDVLHTKELILSFPRGRSKTDGKTVTSGGVYVVSDSEKTIDLKIAADLGNIKRTDASVLAGIIGNRIKDSVVTAHTFTDAALLKIEFSISIEFLAKTVKGVFSELRKRVSQEELARALKEKERYFESLKEFPGEFNSEFGWEIALESDPCMSVGEKLNALKGITCRNINRYMDKFFEPGNISVLLFGDVKKADVDFIDKCVKNVVN